MSLAAINPVSDMRDYNKVLKTAKTVNLFFLQKTDAAYL